MKTIIAMLALYSLFTVAIVECGGDMDCCQKNPEICKTAIGGY